MAGALEIARRALDELGFFSKALEEAKGAKMKSGTVQQWKNTLQKQGVKPAELDATGFSALPPDKPLSKDDLVDYLTQNRVQLGEKKLTSQPQEVPLDLAQRLNDAEMELLRLQDAGVRGQALTDAIRRYDQLENEMERFTVRNGAEAKYQQWSLPGGQNYQETLLKLPTPTDAAFGQGVRANSSAPTFGPHRNPHWDDPNVAVHYRTKERLGPNGERVLHIDEVQSDWGQQGAREGFFDPNLQKAQREAEAAYKKASDDYMQVVREHQQFVRENYPRDYDMSSLSDAELQPLERARQDRMRADPRFGELLDRRDAASNRMSETRAAMDRLPSQDGAVPMAPFVTDEKAWTDLALKRAMIEAERGGYDALAFTRGAQQAERYNLNERVRRILYDPENRMLSVLASNGDLLHHGEYAPDRLPDVIGRENAERLLASRRYTNEMGAREHTLSPSEMTWGAKGMARYYDQALPSRIDKLARSLDPEARLETMPAGRKLGLFGQIDEAGHPTGTYRVYDDALPYDDPTNSLAEVPAAEARAFVNAHHWPRGGEIPTLNMLRLTPRMKEQIRQGLPLFVGAPVVAGGALSALEQPAPPANEFARGGPVRDQREQDRLRDIERMSPSEEMLGDLVYRNYLPGYDLLAAARPIGGTDTVRLPPVRRFYEGGYADPADMAGPDYSTSQNWESSYTGPNFDANQSYNEWAADYYGGGYGSGDGINWGDFFQQSQDLTNIANQVASDPSYFGGGAEAGEPGFTGIGGDIMSQAGIGVPEAPYAGSPFGGLGMDFFSSVPTAQQQVDVAAAIPSADAFDPNLTGPASTFEAPFSGTLADIAASSTFAGGMPAGVSEMQRETNRAAGLGSVGTDVSFDDGEVSREVSRAAGFGNIEVPSRLPDGRMAAEYFGPPGNQTMRVNADLDSPYQAQAFQTALREMEERDMATLRDIGRAREILSSRSQNTLTDEDRAIPVAGAPAPAPTQTAALDPMVMDVLDEVAGLPAPAPQLAGNVASSKFQYTEDPNNPFALAGSGTALVGPFSPQGVRNTAAVGQTEVDVIARQMAREIAREQGITVQQAMPDARAMALQHYVETVQNRSAAFGPKGFGGQTYNPTIEQVLEQRAAFSAVPNTQSRVDGRYPGRVENLPVSDEYLAATERVLSGIAAGRRDFPNATHFMNPDESSPRAMSQWGTDFVRDPSTVKVAGPPGSSHYVGNPDGIAVPAYETLPPSGAVPNNLPSSISANDRAVRGGRRADASEEGYGLSDIARELFGIGTAQAAPVSAPAPQYDFGAVDRQDTMGMTGASRRAGDALAAGLYNAGREMRGMNEAPIVGSSGVAQSRGSAMTDTLADSPPIEEGDISSETRAAARPSGRGTAIADVASDLPEPAPSTNRFAVDPLTGRMYDPVTGDRVINPNYVSRGIDFALTPAPVIGQVNGLLALAGGLTGYPLSAGQLMALGRPGTPLGNAGAGSGADQYGNYGSYGEGGADRLPPAREMVAALPAISGGGGGTLSTAAATTSLSDFLRRRYLGEDEDPRTYGMRSQRRYYDYG